jgi:hypothetical protein
MKKVAGLFVLFFLAAVNFSFAPQQILNTKLKITVRNDLGNLEEGVAVTLYENEEDYRNNANQVDATGFTDAKGTVTFKSLKPQVYFIDARKDDKTNVDMGVQTGRLEEKKTNKVTIVIS